MESFPEYDYSKSIYRRSKEKLIIGCPIHGEFYLKPNALFTGHGCPKCGISRLGDGVRLTQEEFVDRATIVHRGLYNYSISKYIIMTVKIEILCKKHGSFWQLPHNHLCGAGCPQCKLEFLSQMRKYPFEMHVKNFRKRHGNIYDYSKANYIDYNTKIEIVCPKHGSFWQSTNAHSMGVGCPYCSKSKAEGRIREWLIKNGVLFIPQHFFSDCKNIRYLYFDFFLPVYNICIEYDGELHYKPFRKSSSGQEKLQETQRNDRLKNEYCEKMHIKLVRIPYWKKSGIEKILKDLLEEFKV
jgi:ssDNA-binding Zn-finger/Zn-ribbon topoisomerase 1